MLSRDRLLKARKQGLIHGERLKKEYWWRPPDVDELLNHLFEEGRKKKKCEETKAHSTMAGSGLPARTVDPIGTSPGLTEEQARDVGSRSARLISTKPKMD